jgi:hypothetical protein
VDLETFFENLYKLTSAQWRVILALLICANLIVYATVTWIWWAFVYRQPPPPGPPTGPHLTPTLRPTYTPTWTPVVMATPTATATLTPTRTPAP